MDGHRFSGAKGGAVGMRINLALKTLKRATMYIIKFLAGSVFTSEPMTVMARIRT